MIRILKVGLALVMAAGAEWLLPGWFGRWQNAVHAYFDYTGTRSLLELLMGRHPGLLACTAITGIVVVTCWLVRRESASSHAFNAGLLAVVAADMLVKPTFPLYDTIMLLPVILWLWIRGGIIRQESGRTRFLYWITAFLFGWQWIGALALTGTSLFASSSAAQHLPHLPLPALLWLPVSVFFLLALHVRDIWRNRAFLLKPNDEPRGAMGPATASSEVGL